MIDKKEFEEEALAEFLEMTGIPKEKVDQYVRVNRIEFHDCGETYELKNPGLAVIFNSRSSDGFLPVLYFPKALEQKPTNKNCRSCRNQGSHNGICEICKDNKCWTEIESTNKNDCGEQMDFPDTFDEFAKDYGFKDKDEIYTNGLELIPVFRVKQWLEHIFSVTPLPKGQGVSLESLDKDAKETVSHLVECYEDDCFTKDERVTLAGIAFQARLRYQYNKYMSRQMESEES